MNVEQLFFFTLPESLEAKQPKYQNVSGAENSAFDQLKWLERREYRNRKLSPTLGALVSEKGKASFNWHHLPKLKVPNSYKT